jgi:hypothetical protein
MYSVKPMCSNIGHLAARSIPWYSVKWKGEISNQYLMFHKIKKDKYKKRFSYLYYNF